MFLLVEVDYRNVRNGIYWGNTEGFSMPHVQMEALGYSPRIRSRYSTVKPDHAESPSVITWNPCKESDSSANGLISLSSNS